MLLGAGNRAHASAERGAVDIILIPRGDAFQNLKTRNLSSVELELTEFLRSGFQNPDPRSLKFLGIK